MLSGGNPGPHSIQGIGAGFVPENYHASLWMRCCKSMMPRQWRWDAGLARVEGLLCGVSSGAAMAAALRLAQRPEMEGKLIVVVLASFGERYLSTPMFTEIGS